MPTTDAVLSKERLELSTQLSKERLELSKERLEILQQLGKGHSSPEHAELFSSHRELLRISGELLHALPHESRRMPSNDVSHDAAQLDVATAEEGCTHAGDVHAERHRATSVAFEILDAETWCIPKEI